MKAKENFRRITLSDMQAKREAVRASHMLDEVCVDMEKQVERERWKTLCEMGYATSNEPTPEEYELLQHQLKADGKDVEVRQAYEPETKRVTVEILVVQVARSLTFHLGGESDDCI